MKIRIAITAVLLSTVLVSLPFAAGQQSIYEKALVLEETQLKLQEAIALYQQVVAESKDKALAAQAQLRIGLCHEKLGAAEAEKAFRKVIEDYAEQSAAVRVARERLFALAGSTTSASSNSNGLVLQQKPWPPGEPSPDGRYLAYVDYDSSNIAADLALYEVATGNKKVLTNLSAGKSKTSYTMVNEPICWTADGTQMAFITLSTDSSDRSSKIELWTVQADGSNLTLIPGNFGEWTWIAGWTADGKSLIATMDRMEGYNSIWRISLPDGNLKRIRKNIKGSEAILSPDSRYIAYESSSGAAEALNRDIHIVPLDGSSDIPVIEHPADDSLMGWSADGTHIVFFSKRNGDQAIWIQEIKEGQPSGDPHFIKSVADNADGLGYTKNGSFYFTERKIGGTDVFTAQIDLRAGKTLKPPVNVEPAFARHSSTPFWSPSGDSLGYLVRGANNGYFEKLRLHDQKNGTQRDIALNFRATSFQQPPRWDAEGKYIYLTGSTDGESNGLYQIEVSTGQCRLIHQGGSMEYIRAWSSDGTIVYLTKSDRSIGLSDRIDSIIRRDLRNDEEREIMRSSKPGEQINCTGLSPDGKWLGLSIRQPGSAWFCVMPAEGGTVRRLVQQGSEAFGAYFFWSPLSDGALFERKTSTEGIYSLSYMPSFESMERIDFDLEMPRINGLTFHPDGKTIAFDTISLSETKVWVMENFLPAKK